VVYHANPTEAKIVGGLIEKYHGTFLLSTPTFCGNYVRKCSAQEFASLRFVLVGAEKLREPIAAAFQAKFGLRPLEGYGCTEMSPVVAVNVPDFAAGRDTQAGGKAGTVGHPLPGVAVRVVDRVTMEPLEPNEEGLLLVKGANRMLGYLGRPELTCEVVRDGWYVTGDIAAVDDEGFIRITDRLSRFSKIGGEMVPHLRVEEVICNILGDQSCVVTGVPDEQRGERRVVLYMHAKMTPADLWQRLSQTELPRLWAPKRDDIYQVGSLPTLGTGKMDLDGPARYQSRSTAVVRRSLGLGVRHGRSPVTHHTCRSVHSLGDSLQSLLELKLRVDNRVAVPMATAFSIPEPVGPSSGFAWSEMAANSA
jgi:acyl-[acyl-carrier-protein]-phospholipid O-acyltransferase/long-chain-fatty-acid--[acyl-carrier-protein] ligase